MARSACRRLSRIVSQTLYIRLRALGFDRSTGEIDVEMLLEPLDEKGKALIPKAIRAVVHNEDAHTVRKRHSKLRAELKLSRAGNFRLRITLNDLKTKKTVSFEAAMHVVAP